MNDEYNVINEDARKYLKNKACLFLLYQYYF